MVEACQGWMHGFELVEKFQFSVLIRTKSPAFFLKNASGSICTWPPPVSSSRRNEKLKFNPCGQHLAIYKDFYSSEAGTASVTTFIKKSAIDQLACESLFPCILQSLYCSIKKPDFLPCAQKHAKISPHLLTAAGYCCLALSWSSSLFSLLVSEDTLVECNGTWITRYLGLLCTRMSSFSSLYRSAKSTILYPL